MSAFDIIIIGAGPGGYVAAIRAAQLGMKVGVVEKWASLGGTCLNVGCIPSKALLESSHHYHSLKHDFSSHGILTSGVAIDVPRMIDRKRKVVGEITGGVAFLFKKNKIEILKGHAKIIGQGKVLVKNGVEEKTSEAKNIIIATGSTPIELPSAPFDHKVICDSEDALEWTTVPKKLLVVGGGVIGLELGSVWSRLGSEVHVIEASSKILGTMDGGLSTAAESLFVKDGMHIHKETFLKSSEISPDGTKAKLVCEVKGDKVEFIGDRVLVAVGRRPYTDGLFDDPSHLGIKLEKGRVVVDQHFKATDGIYAIGDVIHGPMLAHKAEEEGVALAEFLANGAGHVNYAAIPSIVYTSPEIASVGMSEEEAKTSGIAYRSGKFMFKANGRAKAAMATNGFVKILADEKSDRILGVHILGANASELIGECVIAIEFGASAEDLARSVHAHPTLAEAIKEAALDVAKRAIHS